MNTMALDKIKAPNDIKKLSKEEILSLPEEIRQFIINNLSETGGHLGPNLGAVELTIALHLCLNFPKDKLIFDVSHQSYTHKILTGRKDEFKTLRQFNGMSGFLNRDESNCDAFGTGHASTSISAGLGMAYARDIEKKDYKVVSVIGDGALTGGLALEGINNVANLKSNFTIILNDNTMSISKNVGGMSLHLSKLRTSETYMDLKKDITTSIGKIPYLGRTIVKNIGVTKTLLKQLLIPGMLFEELGIMYLGPVDGHDIKKMVSVIRRALSVKGPVIVHVVTKKGKGYLPAEKHPARFHGTSPFDLKTGIPISREKATYTDIFSTVIKKMGERDEKVVAVTAAMEIGTGLKRFHNSFPDRFFDVGIAEEHAVTFSAGLSASGLKPIFAVYSTFLQRAYDEILHDVCIQRLPVVFAIDHAGIVGADGVTHQGIFDISYLLTIPNMVIMAPKNKWEFSDMIKFAFKEGKPIAIRYPKGEAYCGLSDFRSPIKLGKSEELYEGQDVLIFALGSMVSIGEKVRNILLEDSIDIGLTNARFASPLDEDYLLKKSKKYKIIVTMEENVKSGGFGEHITKFLCDSGYKGKILNIALPDEFVPHGSRNVLLKHLGMDEKTVAEKIKEVYKSI